MALKLSRKSGNPYRDAPVVTAVHSFAGGDGMVIQQGAKYRGDDPVVEAHWGVFAEGDLLPNEIALLALDARAEPVEHSDERIRIGGGVTPAPHRQVVALADTFTPLPFAPGSPGASGRMPIPPAPFGTGIKKGRVYDVPDPVVRANPTLFEFPRRDVTLADIERIARLEGGDAAA